MEFVIDYLEFKPLSWKDSLPDTFLESDGLDYLDSPTSSNQEGSSE